MTEAPQLSQIQLDSQSLVGWANDSAKTPLELEVVVTAEGVSTTVELKCAELLRFLPERRIVCAAMLDGKPVVVKWFIGPGAERYQQRELRGALLLRNAEICTPQITALWRARGDEQFEVFALVFEQLVDAQPLTDELLQSSPHWSAQLWQLLADLHGAALTHADLHFGNLLCCEQQLWLIDGDAVTSSATGAPGVSASVQQFAGLAAQFCASASFAELRMHWQSYCAARQWSEVVSPALIERRYRAARRQRIRHYQAKTQRTCSAFAQRRSILGSALLDRDWLRTFSSGEVAGEVAGEATDEAVVGRELLSWLDSLPQLMLEAPASGALKRGNTATVVAANFCGRSLIVKRYNNKSLWHRLRRWIRGDRGLNSWVYAHTLSFVGIPAFRAVALLQTRFAGPTYLVMDALPGAELQPQVLSDRSTADEFERVSQQLVSLLEALAAEGLVHNDTKASNFLWDASTGNIALIDLDAMRMPASRRAARNGHERDRQRLLRNFAATPELQRRFRSLLGL